MLNTLLHEPALWGFLGAFIYAAPRMMACILTCREASVSTWPCVFEFAIALATGAIAAAAFGAAVIRLIHLNDMNAVAATIGLLANPFAPRMVATASGVLNTALKSKLGRALQGDDKS